VLVKREIDLHRDSMLISFVALIADAITCTNTIRCAVASDCCIA